MLRDNDVRRSGKGGVLFRAEDRRAFAQHRNRLEKNRITDSGPEDGIGIDVQGETEGLALLQNELREKRRPRSRIGIRLGPRTRDIRLGDNQIDGFAMPLADLCKP